VIGDAVHNLNSALDLLAFGMVGDQAPTPDRVLFPFAKSANGLCGTITNRQIQLAGKDVVDAIKELKPYPGGNDMLYNVHALDVRDKHHIILTVAGVSIFNASEINRLLGTELFKGPITINILDQDGRPIITQPLEASRAVRRAMPYIKQQAEVSPAFSISFGKGEPISGLVVANLRLMTESVEAAIEKIASAYQPLA
jgi:hypothetical protein